MAEKVTLNPEPFSRNYDGKPFIIFQSTDAKKVGDKISPQNGTDFSTNLLTPIDKQTYERLEQKGTSSLVKNTNPQGVESYFGVIGKVQGDKLEFSDIIDEFPRSIIDSLEKDAPELVKESKDSLNTYLKNKNLSTSSSTSPVIPNQAASGSSSQREQPSTPVATGLGQRVTYKKTKTVLVYPINMDDSQDCMEFAVYKYAKRGIDENFTRLSAFETSKGIIVDENYTRVGTQTVFLPVTKISDTNSVNWNDDQLNEFQRFGANVSLQMMQPGATGDIKASLEAALGGAKQAFDYATGSGPFANYMRSLAAGAAVQANNLLSRTSAAILNPNMELLFNNPALRQFQFSFDLIAKSREEAEEIKQIIRFFKKNMAVRAGEKIGDVAESDVGSGDNKITEKFNEGNSVFLSSPYLFRLRYLAGSVVGSKKPHQSIGQIKMCALQNFSTDYTPMNTYMTFNDEKRTMFMYRLSMSFKELTPIYNTDYIENVNDDNYHPIGF
jgi:hypothetical protein